MLKTEMLTITDKLSTLNLINIPNLAENTEIPDILQQLNNTVSLLHGIVLEHSRFTCKI